MRKKKKEKKGKKELNITIKRAASYKRRRKRADIETVQGIHRNKLHKKKREGEKKEERKTPSRVTQASLHLFTEQS